MRPQSPRITIAKRIGGMAQVVRYLLCKHETLSSNANSTTKTKKGKTF
jgi:hypothetical protein